MGGLRPNLVFVPSDDVGFSGHVAELIEEPEVAAWLQRLDHTAFQKRIRERFPNATVRPREDIAQMLPDDPPIWYVSRGRERFRLRATVAIGSPRADVFRVYVDPASLELWQGVARVRTLTSSPAVVGNSWEAEYEILRVKLAGTFRIVQAEPPARVRVEAWGPLRSRLWYVSRFQERDGATIIDVEGDYELPFELLTRVPSRLFAEREIERVVARSHERLKALCETTVGGGGLDAREDRIDDATQGQGHGIAEAVPLAPLPAKVPSQATT